MTEKKTMRRWVCRDKDGWISEIISPVPPKQDETWGWIRSSRDGDDWLITDIGEAYEQLTGIHLECGGGPIELVVAHKVCEDEDKEIQHTLRKTLCALRKAARAVGYKYEPDVHPLLRYELLALREELDKGEPNETE